MKSDVFTNLSLLLFDHLVISSANLIDAHMCNIDFTQLIVRAAHINFFGSSVS